MRSAGVRSSPSPGLPAIREAAAAPLDACADDRGYPPPRPSPTRGEGELERAHADPPARRRRLRHAAVRAERGPRRHARADELHQPRAWRLRHARRLCHGVADEPRRRALSGDAADRLPRSRDRRRRAGAHALSAALWREPARSGAVHHRPRLHGDAGRQLSARRSAAADQPAGVSSRAGSNSHGVGIGVYRLFTILLCGAIAAGVADLSGRDALRRAAARGGR